MDRRAWVAELCQLGQCHLRKPDDECQPYRGDDR
jgi:hypothetical protein